MPPSNDRSRLIWEMALKPLQSSRRQMSLKVRRSSSGISCDGRSQSCLVSVFAQMTALARSSFTRPLSSSLVARRAETSNTVGRMVTR